MSEPSTQKLTLSVRIGVLCIFLVCVVGLISALPNWRLDLTQDKLYTLSDGSKRILENLSQPIELTFFFSEQVTQDLPQIRDYASRVKELLQEYEASSHGLIRLNVIDPVPFSEEEDQAAELGLQAVPASAGGDMVYFGLAGKDLISAEGKALTEKKGEAGVDQGESEITQTTTLIPFFNPQREAFLEYEISQLLFKLQRPDPVTIGVMSSLNVFEGYDAVKGLPHETWLVIEQLKDFAEVKSLTPNINTIADDIDLLVLIHPKDLPDSTLYAIDQFLLGGGQAMIFVDPHSEVGTVGSSLSVVMPQANSSNLTKLFDHWGVQYHSQQVVADARWALRLGTSQDGRVLPHLGILGLKDDAINRDSVATSDLEVVNLSTAGHIEPVEGSQLKWDVLLHSSHEANVLASERFLLLENHGDLLNDFQPSKKQYIFAAQVEGEVTSAFDSVPAPKNKELNAEQGVKAAREADQVSSDTLIEESIHLASGSLRVFIAADTDLLSDRLWVQVSHFFGERIAAPWANNGDMMANVAENMSGSEALISIRSRGKYSRPFTVVEALQRQAADKFNQQEQQLLTELDALEQQIQQLSEVQPEGLLQLSQAQQDQVDRFEQQKIAVRKDLRQVQHQLNHDIDTLGTYLKLINIMLIPCLLTLGVMLLAWRHGRRRRA